MAKRAIIPEESEARQTDKLTLRAIGDPDPRLVKLVRLLARQAAREYFEAAMKQQQASKTE